MPTPKLYAGYASRLTKLFQRPNGWRFLGVLAAVGLTLVVIGRAYPSTDPVVGLIIYVLMFGYFALIAPWVAFPRPVSIEPHSMAYQVWGWTRAILCSLMIAFCLWAIWFGLAR
ncbi:hypothetical protein [Variovorax sp. PDC80]|uniref:hypothetical protein n=1 Tax=Variovorax sp. PDC80 TaxID=1882827 RepID=UPI0011609050|nr:hypothetical protein [Variovorax sp. PDC80]